MRQRREYPAGLPGEISEAGASAVNGSRRPNPVSTALTAFAVAIACWAETRSDGHAGSMIRFSNSRGPSGIAENPANPPLACGGVVLFGPGAPRADGGRQGAVRTTRGAWSAGTSRPGDEELDSGYGLSVAPSIPAG